MKRNKYKRRINDRRYYVKVAEFSLLPYVKVVVSDSMYNANSATRFVSERKFFCDDVQKFASDKLSEAVQIREDRSEERNQYDEKIERGLDVVKEVHEGE